MLVLLIPKNENQYLCEYIHKLELLEKVDSPRVVIIGGSSVAYGTDSRMISDSLGLHFINFGLHAGLGIKYPLEDYLNYMKKGDVVILQMEYSNFYG